MLALEMSKWLTTLGKSSQMNVEADLVKLKGTSGKCLATIGTICGSVQSEISQLLYSPREPSPLPE